MTFKLEEHLIFVYVLRIFTILSRKALMRSLIEDKTIVDVLFVEIFKNFVTRVNYFSKQPALWKIH